VPHTGAGFLFPSATGEEDTRLAVEERRRRVMVAAVVIIVLELPYMER
jgi:hypothetical protein